MEHTQLVLSIIGPVVILGTIAVAGGKFLQSVRTAIAAMVTREVCAATRGECLISTAVTVAKALEVAAEKQAKEGGQLAGSLETLAVKLNETNHELAATREDLKYQRGLWNGSEEKRHLEAQR